MFKRILHSLFSFLLILVLSTPIPVNAHRPSANNASNSAAAMANVIAIQSGGNQTCALTAAGDVLCWGDSGYLDTINIFPTKIPNLPAGVTAIAVGWEHACALTPGGGVKCWGDNSAGELGNNSHMRSRIPVDVIGLNSGVKAITAGGYFTCALTTGGEVKCWGDNSAGKLGNGTNTDSSVPVVVKDLPKSVTAVAAGASHACAILSDSVKCWGYNGQWQLGNGKNAPSNVPVNVTGLGSGGVTAIAAGSVHTCAIVNSGVKCWGSILEAVYPTPRDVTGLSGVIAIATGGDGDEEHICAIITNNALKCWGSNNYGQVGDGTMEAAITPVPVLSLSNGVSAVTTGYTHTCAIQDGQIKCWGSNAYGQVGKGVTIQRMIPVEANQLQAQVTSLSAGWYNTCAITGWGAALCWGNNRYGQLGNGNNMGNSGIPGVVYGLTSGVTNIATGSGYNCAVVYGGVKCWGINIIGGLGDGTLTTRFTPVDAVGLPAGSGVTKVVIGPDGHTCALTTTGSVKCWGNNQGGQAAANSADYYTVPTNVSGWITGIQDITAGYYLTCALTIYGAVECAGLLQDAVGMVEYDSPTRISGLDSGVKAISTGAQFACALTDAGGVKCWGDNSFGQLGNNTTLSSITPVDVIGLSNHVQAISLGFDHACALLESGGVECWGRGANLGTGSFADYSGPVTVQGLSEGVVAISAGYEHTCALLANNGPVKCWGMDGYGQLAVGTVTSVLVPNNLVAALPPTIKINHPNGQSGSYFTITGENFPPFSLLTVAVNGYVLTTTLPVSETGSFIFFLGTEAADLGDYRVTVNEGGGNDIVTASFNPLAAVIFRLQATAPLRMKEGGGTVFSVPPGVAQTFTFLYLPVVNH